MTEQKKPKQPAKVASKKVVTKPNSKAIKSVVKVASVSKPKKVATPKKETLVSKQIEVPYTLMGGFLDEMQRQPL